MYGTYEYSSVYGSPVCGPNVTDFRNTYRGCKDLTGAPVCGDKVTDMSDAYADCESLSGNAVCGPNVTNMHNAYQNCYSLTGAPACGDKVTDMSNAYQNCYNLTGNAVCGNNVTNMAFAYANSTVRGVPVCGPKVTNMQCAYENCQYVSTREDIVIGKNVIDISGAFRNSYVLSGRQSVNIVILSPNVTSATAMVEGIDPDIYSLDIYVPAGSKTLSAITSDNYFYGDQYYIYWSYSSYGYYYAYDRDGQSIADVRIYPNLPSGYN